MDLGSTSGVQFSLSDLMGGYLASEKLNNENYEKTALNEDIPVHEWQPKVKHVITD